MNGRSECKLDSYDRLDMFGEPCKRPQNSNVLPLIWIYGRKLDGTKKARCVCNGSPNIKGMISLAYTYAAALEDYVNQSLYQLIIN